MGNILQVDYQYIQSRSRLITLFAVMAVSNIVVFGVLGWLIGETKSEALIYGVGIFLAVTILAPVLKSIPHLIGYELQLKAQLRLFFLKLLADNSFPKNIPLSSNGDKWLTDLKMNESLTTNQRVMAAELLLILQSIISSNSNLPKVQERVVAVFTESVSDYINNS